MDTQKIKNSVKYYADIIKEVDNGKILALGSKVLEFDPGKIKKALNFSTEGPLTDKADHIWRLSKDIAVWPVNYVQGLVGALKNRGK